MNSQCDTCKWSTPKFNFNFVTLCLLVPFFGWAIFLWVFYSKLFNKTIYCYNSKVNYLVNFNKNQNCKYWLSNRSLNPTPHETEEEDNDSEKNQT